MLEIRDIFPPTERDFRIQGGNLIDQGSKLISENDDRVLEGIRLLEAGGDLLVLTHRFVQKPHREIVIGNFVIPIPFYIPQQ